MEHKQEEKNAQNICLHTLEKPQTTVLGVKQGTDTAWRPTCNGNRLRGHYRTNTIMLPSMCVGKELNTTNASSAPEVTE